MDEMNEKKKTEVGNCEGCGHSFYRMYAALSNCALILWYRICQSIELDLFGNAELVKKCL